MNQKRKILFLSSWFPYPPNNGSKLRIYNLLYSLAQQHEVTLLSFADLPLNCLDFSGLQPFCKKIRVISWKPFDEKSKRALLGFFRLTPRSVADTYSLEMEQIISDELTAIPYDALIVSQIRMAAYAKLFQGLPTLLEEIEITILFEQFTQATSLWNRFRYGLTWLKHKHYINRLLQNFTLCTVVSEREKELVTRMTSNRIQVEVIPNCVDVNNYSDIDELPQPNKLVFSGSFSYFANYDAICWFVNEVFQKILFSIPNVHLIITGDNAGLPLPNLTNITLSGLVDDVKPVISSSWISLAPIREGGGTRYKILEAMALRTPVVSTSKGVEGLDVQNNVHLLVGDSPDEFANAVIRILREPGLHDMLAENAYTLVQQMYDWSIYRPKFLRLVEKLSLLKGS